MMMRKPNTRRSGGSLRLLASMLFLATACGDGGGATDADAGPDDGSLPRGDSSSPSPEDAGDDSSTDEKDGGHEGEGEDENDGGAGDGGSSDDAGNPESDGGDPEDCEPLPSPFVLAGCDFDHLCQAITEGCDAEVHCVDLPSFSLDLSAEESEVALRGEGTDACRLWQDGGKLRGECPQPTDDDAEATCGLAQSSPMPDPACLELPDALQDLDACDGSMESLGAAQCALAQNACDVLVVCDEGAQALQGAATDTGLTLEVDGARCEATLEGETLTGTCADAEGEQLCALAGEMPQPERAECEQHAPEEGYVLTGCGRDERICHMTQRGCVWKAACGQEIYRGRSEGGNSFPFTSPLGAACTASVVDHGLAGHCAWSNEECDFANMPAVPGDDCPQLPAEVEITRCGETLACKTSQHGCRWQASCDGGLYAYRGEIDDSGLQVQLDEGVECAVPGVEAGFEGSCDALQCEDDRWTVSPMSGGEGETDPEEGETDPEEGETDPEEGETDPEEGETDPGEDGLLARCEACIMDAEQEEAYRDFNAECSADPQCQAVKACMIGNVIAETGRSCFDGIPADCFCGIGADLQACETGDAAPQGPCVDEMLAGGLEGLSAGEAFAGMTSTAHATGRAYMIVDEASRVCTAECGFRETDFR